MVKKAGKSAEFFRSFTIEGSSIGFTGGVFVSKTPGSASKKATRKLFKVLHEDSEYARFRGDKKMQFILRESTQGSSHKTLAYDGYKNKLSPPVVRKLPGGKEYVIEFEYKTKALKEHQVHDSLKHHLKN